MNYSLYTYSSSFSDSRLYKVLPQFLFLSLRGFIVNFLYLLIYQLSDKNMFILLFVCAIYVYMYLFSSTLYKTDK